MESLDNKPLLPKTTMVKIAKEKTSIDRVEAFAAELFWIEAEKLLIRKWEDAHLHAIKTHPNKKTVCMDDVRAAFEVEF